MTGVQLLHGPVVIPSRLAMATTVGVICRTGHPTFAEAACEPELRAASHSEVPGQHRPVVAWGASPHHGEWGLGLEDPAAKEARDACLSASKSCVKHERAPFAPRCSTCA